MSLTSYQAAPSRCQKLLRVPRVRDMAIVRPQNLRHDSPKPKTNARRKISEERRKAGIRNFLLWIFRAFLLPLEILGACRFHVLRGRPEKARPALARRLHFAHRGMGARPGCPARA